MNIFQMVVQPMDMKAKVPEKLRNGELKILGEKIEMKKDLSPWQPNGKGKN